MACAGSENNFEPDIGGSCGHLGGEPLKNLKVRKGTLSRSACDLLTSGFSKWRVAARSNLEEWVCIERGQGPLPYLEVYLETVNY